MPTQHTTTRLLRSCLCLPGYNSLAASGWASLADLRLSADAIAALTRPLFEVHIALFPVTDAHDREALPTGRTAPRLLRGTYELHVAVRNLNSNAESPPSGLRLCASLCDTQSPRQPKEGPQWPGRPRCQPEELVGGLCSVSGCGEATPGGNVAVEQASMEGAISPHMIAGCNSGTVRPRLRMAYGKSSDPSSASAAVTNYADGPSGSAVVRDDLGAADTEAMKATAIGALWMGSHEVALPALGRGEWFRHASCLGG